MKMTWSMGFGGWSAKSGRFLRPFQAHAATWAMGWPAVAGLGGSWYWWQRSPDEVDHL